MIKFKKGITGFIYNTEDCCITKIFNNSLKEEEVAGFNKFSDRSVLFTSEDIEEVLDLFNIENNTDIVDYNFDLILEEI